MKIYFTKNAEKNFNTIQKYLQDEWGDKSKERFILKTKHALELLRQFPQLGTKEVEMNKIHGLLIHKHVRLFYKIYSDRISILALFDLRQNPKRRPK
jgi:plasmid stabilization system protein ParE